MIGLLFAACNVTPIPADAPLGSLTQVRASFTSVVVGAAPNRPVIVFDAGLGGGARQLRNWLEDQSLTLDQVDTVFLTHHHSDHVGGLDVLEQASIVAHRDEVPLLANEGVTVDQVVEDGSVVNVGGWSVEVFHVPGHTPGSAVYLVDGVLITGDVAIQERDGQVGPAPERFSDDPAEAESSLCSLISRLSPRAGEIEHVAYAHSGPSDFAGFASASCPTTVN